MRNNLFLVLRWGKVFEIDAKVKVLFFRYGFCYGAYPSPKAVERILNSNGYVWLNRFPVEFQFSENDVPALYDVIPFLQARMKSVVNYHSLQGKTEIYVAPMSRRFKEE